MGKKLCTKQALCILSFDVCIWEQMTAQILDSIFYICFKNNLICFSGAGEVLYVSSHKYFILISFAVVFHWLCVCRSQRDL